MMQFNEYNEATNSIKTVIIVNHGMMNRSFSSTGGGEYMVFTPEGRLLDDVTSAGPFASFEEARRNAEINVGMKMNWSDF